MTAHANLLRDGIERTANHVLRRLRVTGNRRQALLVRRYGRVAVCAPSEVADWSDESVIGTYDSTVPPEVVEGDLLLRLRELAARLADADAE